MINKKQRSNAAKKAHQTMRARRDFNKKYPGTALIVQDLIYAARRHFTTKDVATWNRTTVTRVAAVLANLNRDGTFRTMAAACKW